jgi:hypothetical protein
MVIPDAINILGPGQITVNFGNNVAGRAVVLSGSLEGNTKPSYAYEYSQTTPNAVWVIDHNLGYQPVVRVFSGSYEIQPQSIFHNSANQVTITFSSAQVGVVKFI